MPYEFVLHTRDAKTNLAPPDLLEIHPLGKSPVIEIDGEAGAPLHPRITAELDNHFSYMESVLRPSGHFVLDGLSAADIMLSFPAQIAMRLERRSTYPKLAAFVDRIEARPAYIRAVEKGGV